MINRSALPQLSTTRNFFSTEKEAIALKNELEANNKAVRIDQIAIFCDDMQAEELTLRNQEIEARIATLVDANESQKNFLRKLVTHKDCWEVVVIADDAVEFWNKDNEMNVATYDDELNGATVYR